MELIKKETEDLEYYVTVELERVKEERDLDQESSLRTRVKEEAGGQTECGVSAAAARAGLYAEHEVKEEVVAGPTAQLPPDTVVPSVALETYVIEETIEQSNQKSKPIRGVSCELRVTADRIPIMVVPPQHVTPNYDTNIQETVPTRKTSKHKVVKMVDKNKCDICQRQFSRNQYLKLHERTHTGEKPFKCEICLKQFSFKQHLARHARSHTGEEPYKCEICQERFIQRHQLISHREIHTGEKPFKSDICSKDFPNSGDLHGRKSSMDTKYECEICFKELSSPSSLARHLKQHVEEKPRFECEFCNREFANESTLIAHRYRQTGEKQYECGRPEVPVTNVLTAEQTDETPGLVQILQSTPDTREYISHSDGPSDRRGGKKTPPDRLRYDDDINLNNTNANVNTLRNDKVQLTGETVEKQSQYHIYHEHFPIEMYREHERMHFPGRIHECEICMKRLFHKKNLKTPQITHTGEKPFECVICNKLFATKPALVQHSAVHTGEKPYKCEFCPKEFAYRVNLLRHGKTHTGEKTYQCNISSLKKLRYSNNLNEHTRLDSGAQPLQCEICLKIFGSQSGLSRHKRSHSAEESSSSANLVDKITCKDSGSEYVNDEINMKNNSNVHIQNDEEQPNDLFASEHCSQNTAVQLKDEPAKEQGTPSDVNVICHEQVATKNRSNAQRMHSENNYQCEVCKRTFSLRENFEKHKTTHIGVKTFKCEICQKLLTTKKILKEHMRIHTGEKPYKCEICFQQFSFNCNLMRHKRTHTDEEPYKCEICSKSFKKLSKLTNHQRSHEADTSLKCEFCFKFFSSHYILNHHKHIHAREITYECEICQESFTCNVDLIQHKQTHLGKIPYECIFCRRQFLRKSALMRHENVYTRENPYKCEVCLKHFAKKGYLKIHRRLHTGERPYKCEICSQPFTHKHNLTAHEKIHTNEPYKCNICQEHFKTVRILNEHKKLHAGEKFQSYLRKANDRILNLNMESNSGQPLGRIGIEVSDEQVRGSSSQTMNQDMEPNVLQASDSLEISYKEQDATKNSAVQSPNVHINKQKNNEREQSLQACGEQFPMTQPETPMDISNDDAVTNEDNFVRPGDNPRLLDEGKSVEEKPFECAICLKQFTRKLSLKLHEKLHEEKIPKDKIYECTFCRKKFATKKYLNIHARIHTNVKPYKCEVCSKEFSFRQNLGTHIRIHTGEKPYPCDVCGKSLRSHRSLVEHKRTHTGEKPFECENCLKRFTSQSGLKTHKRNQWCRADLSD